MRRNRCNFSPGFTLIELLIVVAIIAILAAIAIPNFLEAQTRAKVSRAISDMRSVGVGLESFRIDNKSYPVRPLGEVTMLVGLLRLTTPIAYMSAVPSDVFALNLKESYPTQIGDLMDGYKIGTEYVYPRSFDYYNRVGNEEWRTLSSYQDTVQWALRSVGPDNFPTWLSIGAPAYDPTNGTSSYGDIYYTGPGIGLDQPLEEMITYSDLVAVGGPTL